MIHKVRVKFIVLSTISLFILLTLIVTSMNVINYSLIVQEADQTLSMIVHNKGTFPEENKDAFPNDIPKELPYEIRYFTVIYHTNGSLAQVDTTKISAINTQEAIHYASQAQSKEKQHGFINQYRYDVSLEGNTIRITFLDCGRKLDSFQMFFLSSIVVSLVAFVLVALLFALLSKKIIRPIAQSYEKQKQFITDAGHEMKTPLTIIQANTDLLQMEYGQEDSLKEIQTQVKRMTTLTNDLIALSRMEEKQSIQKIDFPISDILEEVTHSFLPVFQKQNKILQVTIQPNLTYIGDQKAIEKLATILLENASKYSLENTTIQFAFYQQNKHLVLEVKNQTSITFSEEAKQHLFDRFYRPDASRNSSLGGHGIGLSMAQAIVQVHSGKIQIHTEANTFCITVKLPK